MVIHSKSVQNAQILALLAQCKVQDSSTGTGCPGKRLSHHRWKYLKDMSMWHSGMWFSGGFGNDGLTLGLDNLKGIFQPDRCHDSMVKVKKILCKSPYIAETSVLGPWSRAQHPLGL